MRVFPQQALIAVLVGGALGTSTPVGCLTEDSAPRLASDSGAIVAPTDDSSAPGDGAGGATDTGTEAATDARPDAAGDAGADTGREGGAGGSGGSEPAPEAGVDAADAGRSGDAGSRR